MEGSRQLSCTEESQMIYVDTVSPKEVEHNFPLLKFHIGTPSKESTMESRGKNNFIAEKPDKHSVG